MEVVLNLFRHETDTGYPHQGQTVS
jgi:hypothetical protein